MSYVNHEYISNITNQVVVPNGGKTHQNQRITCSTIMNAFWVDCKNLICCCSGHSIEYPEI